MSFDKVAELAEEFVIKIAENQYATKAPADKKASDFSPEEASFIKSLSNKDSNQAQDVNLIDEKVWKRAKKAVKKYWKKYDEPWAVVYDVYRKMGGKPTKKSKKKSELVETLTRKYGYYGHIKNVTPPQNNVQLDNKQIATEAVYKLINSLHNEKVRGHFANNANLEDSYNKLSEFYQSLLTKGKRPKFELYDEAISDPTGFSILEEENQVPEYGISRLTKLDKMLMTKDEVLKRYLEEANEAVRALKQETRS
jgi:hypothetical protein